VTDDRVRCERRRRRLNTAEIFAAAYLLYPLYVDPYTGKPTDIFDAIEGLCSGGEHRQKRGWFFGFSYWKHLWVDLHAFFPDVSMHFMHGKRAFEKALNVGMKSGDDIYIWGRSDYSEVEAFAQRNAVSVFRVEDGFIRSVGLGSDLTQPLSLVVDGRGIYFDPTRPSTLETLLQNAPIDARLTERAANIRDTLLQNRLSKYNLYREREVDVPKGRKTVLVPGQVEDDASLRYGAPGMGNLELLAAVRRMRPDAFIIYKPHPDVLSGNRTGHVDPAKALQYCNRIETEVGIDSVLCVADEVHTMTSLVGFEALLRGVAVTTHGMPFYAGWGLTEDLHVYPRRSRKLSLEMLVAGTLILYPRYRHPLENRPCEVEEVLAAMPALRERYRRSLLQPLLRGLSRVSQRAFRIISGKIKG